MMTNRLPEMNEEDMNVDVVNFVGGEGIRVGFAELMLFIIIIRLMLLIY